MIKGVYVTEDQTTRLDFTLPPLDAVEGIF